MTGGGGRNGASWALTGRGATCAGHSTDRGCPNRRNATIRSIGPRSEDSGRACYGSWRYDRGTAEFGLPPVIAPLVLAIRPMRSAPTVTTPRFVASAPRSEDSTRAATDRGVVTGGGALRLQMWPLTGRLATGRGHLTDRGRPDRRNATIRSNRQASALDPRALDVGSHGVVAAVDVDHLARGHASPVAHEETDHLAHRSRIGE